MAERKWKKISTWMAAWVMAVVFAVSGAQTAFAATSYVNSVSITLDVTPTVGESLPDLDVGYNSDNCEVSIPNNDKYDIVSAKWSSTKNDVKIGGTYTMKVTLKTLNDYRFSSSSYTSSKVKVKNGTFVSASRTSSDRLVVTVKTKPAKGDLDAPGEAYWQTTKSGSSDLGLAKWEAVEDASYEVYLYRGSKNVYKSGEIHTSSCDLFPYMSSKGTYTFKVRRQTMRYPSTRQRATGPYPMRSISMRMTRRERQRKSRQAATTAAQIIPEIPSRPRQM